MQRGYKVRALTRKPEKTKELFSNHPNLEVSAHAGCCRKRDAFNKIQMYTLLPSVQVTADQCSGHTGHEACMAIQCHATAEWRYVHTLTMDSV